MIFMDDGFLLKRTRWFPYLLVIPLLILISLFKIYPIGDSIITSFRLREQWTLTNYQLLFADKTFLNSLLVTLKMNGVMIPLQVVIAFCMALLVNVNIKGVKVFRTIFYLPFCVSLSVATVVWQMMLTKNGGVVNSFLDMWGIGPMGFLTDTRWAWLSIIHIASWRGFPYWMMFFLAGLKGVDESLYEAARIDGAGFWSTLFRITIPVIKNVFLFVFVANTTANFLLFAPVQIATGGGPQGSTNVLMFEAYKSAFLYSNRPRAAAITTIILVIIIMIVALQRKLLDDNR